MGRKYFLVCWFPSYSFVFLLYLFAFHVAVCRHFVLSPLSSLLATYVEMRGCDRTGDILALDALCPPPIFPSYSLFTHASHPKGVSLCATTQERDDIKSGIGTCVLQQEEFASNIYQQASNKLLLYTS